VPREVDGVEPVLGIGAVRHVRHVVRVRWGAAGGLEHRREVDPPERLHHCPPRGPETAVFSG
jgi:hypothetical protein